MYRTCSTVYHIDFIKPVYRTSTVYHIDFIKWVYRTSSTVYHIGVKPLIHQSELGTYTKVVPFQEKSSFHFVVLWKLLNGMD